MDVVRSSVDGVSVAYEDRGTGEPALVFIHGLTGDHSDFEAQMSFFEVSNRVVGIDLPGSGASGRDRSEWTMAAFGKDVIDVIDHLGLDDLVLIGHSLGGDVTVETAKRLHDRVRALVWVSSYRSLGSVKPDSQREEWMAPFSTDFVAAMDDLTRRNFGPNADPDLVDEVAAKARGADPTRAINVLAAKLYNEPALLDGLSKIDAPVFAINPGFKPNDEPSFETYNIELTVINDVGHFVMMEDPDRFNHALSLILTRLTPPPTRET
jgi:pimeloyl-ACP methyl ester carboxylesterase